MVDELATRRAELRAEILVPTLHVHVHLHRASVDLTRDATDRIHRMAAFGRSLRIGQTRMEVENARAWSLRTGQV